MKDCFINYNRDIRNLWSSSIYRIVVILTVFICYGSYAASHIISIDSFGGPVYLGENRLIAQGRFITWGYGRLFSFNNDYFHSSWAINIFSLLLLVWAMCNFSILLRRISGTSNSVGLALFSAILVSYPLMVEIWIFTGSSMMVCAGYLIVSFAILIMQSFSYQKAYVALMFTTGLLICIAAGYESLMAVYIFWVFVILWYEIKDNKCEGYKYFVLHGIWYAIPFVIGTLLGSIIGRVIALIAGVEISSGGAAKEIAWLNGDIVGTLKELVGQIGNIYVAEALISFPIAIFVIACVVYGIASNYICLKLKKPMLLWANLGCYLSLILLSIVQGSASAWRSSQVFAVFIAFTAFLCMEFCNGYLRKVIGFVLIILVIRQVVYTSYCFEIQYEKTIHEERVLAGVAEDLKKMGANKPIVFTGKYTLPDYYEKALSVDDNSIAWKLYARIYAQGKGRSYEDVLNDYRGVVLDKNNIYSGITFNIDHLGRGLMYEYLSMCGYDCELGDAYDRFGHDSYEYVKKNNIPGYPMDGYIVDMEEYVIVNFR